ncbi:hypothetical protein HDU84_003233 [Entophlyctis sp. JEL0112]|nr:hypothetical protein HDU84_003225 [Entophlyctis sp. JEL0112]KAJ3384034.1 hypothetical protein HDU84_003233 [Entophlyctis sp. JEL0112]
MSADAQTVFVLAIVDAALAALLLVSCGVWLWAWRPCARPRPRVVATQRWQPPVRAPAPLLVPAPGSTMLRTHAREQHPSLSRLPDIPTSPSGAGLPSTEFMIAALLASSEAAAADRTTATAANPRYQQNVYSSNRL